MENAAIVIILLVILGLAGYYIYRSKKSGKTCIGCPHSGSCNSGKSGGCNCGCSEEK